MSVIGLILTSAPLRAGADISWRISEIRGGPQQPIFRLGSSLRTGPTTDSESDPAASSRRVPWAPFNELLAAGSDSLSAVGPVRRLEPGPEKWSAVGLLRRLEPSRKML